MAEIEDALPVRLREWCAARGLSPTRVPLGDVYTELQAPLTAPIAYSLLPRRAGTFLSRFLTSWGDLRELTVDDLRSYGGVGVGTIAALLEQLDQRHDTLNLADVSSPTGLFSAAPGPPVSQYEWSILRRWATWERSESVQTLGDVLALNSADLPSDVSSARERLLGTKLVDETVGDFSTISLLDSVRGSLDPRHLEILDRREWGDERETLQEIAVRLNLTRERVRQLHVKAEEAVRRLASGDTELGWLLHQTRREIGVLTTRGAADETLNGLGIQRESVYASMLLYLAGPYEEDDDGFVYLANDDHRGKLAGEIHRTLGSAGHAGDGELSEVASRVGLADQGAIENFLVKNVGLRRFDDEWYLWCGSAIDKAEVVLRVNGVPMTADEITEQIGEGHSFRTVYNGMSQDPRFVRTSKKSWGLKDWGVEEYSGIVEEIFERLDACGGTAEVEWLVNEIVATFDVAENSVRLYLGTLAFVIADGHVRRRTDDDGWPVDTSLRNARGTYRVKNTVRYQVRVTKDVLRGSGQQIPPGMAAVLDVLPGRRRSFRTPSGDSISVGWRPWSTTGPDLGSIRSLAADVGASEGEQLAVVFDTVSELVEAHVLPITADTAATLELLAGVEVGTDAATAIAEAIDVGRREVRSALRSRGDEQVADWLPAAQQADDRLRGAIDELLEHLA